MERLDVETERWIPVEPMLSRRSTLGVAVLNGELYAVGGFDGNNGLDTVEKYNPGMEGRREREGEREGEGKRGRGREREISNSNTNRFLLLLLNNSTEYYIVFNSF